MDSQLMHTKTVRREPVEFQYGTLFPISMTDRNFALRRSNTAYFITIIIVQWADLMICKTRIRSLFEQGMTNTFMIIRCFSRRYWVPFWCMCLWRIRCAARDHCDLHGGLRECHFLWLFTCMMSSAKDGFERMTKDGFTETLIGNWIDCIDSQQFSLSGCCILIFCKLFFFLLSFFCRF